MVLVDKGPVAGHQDSEQIKAGQLQGEPQPARIDPDLQFEAPEDEEVEQDAREQGGEIDSVR